MDCRVFKSLLTYPLLIYYFTLIRNYLLLLTYYRKDLVEWGQSPYIERSYFKEKPTEVILIRPYRNLQAIITPLIVTPQD